MKSVKGMREGVRRKEEKCARAGQETLSGNPKGEPSRAKEGRKREERARREKAKEGGREETRRNKKNNKQKAEEKGRGSKKGNKNKRRKGKKGRGSARK